METIKIKEYLKTFENRIIKEEKIKTVQTKRKKDTIISDKLGKAFKHLINVIISEENLHLLYEHGYKIDYDTNMLRFYLDEHRMNTIDYQFVVHNNHLLSNITFFKIFNIDKVYCETAGAMYYYFAMLSLFNLYVSNSDPAIDKINKILTDLRMSEVMSEKSDNKIAAYKSYIKFLRNLTGFGFGSDEITTNDIFHFDTYSLNSLFGTSKTRAGVVSHIDSLVTNMRSSFNNITK